MLKSSANNYLTSLRQSIVQQLRNHRFPLLFLLGSWGVYFVTVFSHMLQWKPDGLYAGHVHVWGDWSLHIAIAQLFAQKPPAEWFAYHPYYAGGRLTYAFLTNMISGLLMRWGVDIVPAFLVPSILFALAMVFGLYAAYYQILQSKRGALVAVNLFLLASGHGFIRWLAVWLNKPEWQTLLFPTKDFTRLEEYQWLAGNFINGMFIPQRAFLLGMALATWSLAVLLWALQRSPAKPHPWQKSLLVVAGCATGLLPIAHMHSLIALVFIAGSVCLVQWRRWRTWFWYAVPAGILSAILFLKFVAGGIENPEFMQLMIGWTSPPGLEAWLLMWWRIWGVISLIALAGFAWVVVQKQWWRTAFFASFYGLFILGNVWLFQPVQWDNSKLFLWVYFGWAALAALVLNRWWQKNLALKIAAVGLLFVLTASGILEVARLTQFDHNSVQMANETDLLLGHWAATNTPTQAVFLTNTAHNHPVMMWGARPILLGYPTWAWNFGFLFRQREADIKKMYSGQAGTVELLEKYHVSYVVVGPGEVVDQRANEPFFAQRYPLVYDSHTYRVYQVK